MIVTAETAAVSPQRRICRGPGQCWRPAASLLLLLAAARLRKLMTALLIKVTEAGRLGAQCQANYNGSMSLPERCTKVVLSMWIINIYLMTTLSSTLWNQLTKGGTTVPGPPASWNLVFFGKNPSEPFIHVTLYHSNCLKTSKGAPSRGF